METILVVEDEVAISQVLRVYLQKSGFRVVQAFDGEEAIHCFSKEKPALVLLDVMIPGKDGWEVLNLIREKSSCPVIMLTALGDVNYKIQGLHGGADDYVSKPFVADEVIARVQAVLRRSKLDKDEKETAEFGHLIVDFKAHRVLLSEKEVALTPRDLSLLLFLVKHPNQTFTRDQLIERVWGIDYEGSDRAVDLAIKRIRKSLSDWPEEEGEIKTFRGLGYQFSVKSPKV
ncbi:response regulator transcription factor [Evansella tamaricis]|uniref:Response regulator transcription factor n=1 Tax=Evansella tamaricis TaxID=2069301 RepID=A0ABS6JCY9_9BACI|nr:response regulator transcription factor [Evansella tamaricis]MBU9711378.1 response regulator transcription factor [Evansella tamaricis]